jgi:hypothetical protein
MDKFKPTFTVPEGVPNGHLARLKVSVAKGIEAPSCRELYLDVRRAALEAFVARVMARLAAGEPVVVGCDPFRPYRGPTPSEPVTVFFGYDLGRPL